MIAALVIGAGGYGLSITLWVKGARYLGAARGQAIFATVAASGVAVSLRSAHQHTHRHRETVHEHEHWHHDGHHDRAHHDGVVGRHTHVHRHRQFVHYHLHVPDLHHRHGD